MLFTFFRTLLVWLGLVTPDPMRKIREHSRRIVAERARFQPEPMSYQEARAKYLRAC